MSIQATAGPIARQTPALNHYLTEVPENNASSLRSKAFAANVIAKITYTAIVAICATILVISLLAASTSGALPFILLGLAISTPFLAMGAAKLQGMHLGYSQRATLEEGVAEEIRLIKDWTTEDIKQFFTQHNLPLENLPIEELQKLNNKEPLLALLPLIARYRYLNKMASEQEERYKANLHFTSDVPQLRIDARKAALQKHEIEAIPGMLDAAVILQIISQPALEISRDEMGLVKDFQERAFDRLLSNNDDYFVFHDARRPPLKLKQIENALNPDALRMMLFSEPEAIAQDAGVIA